MIKKKSLTESKSASKPKKSSLSKAAKAPKSNLSVPGNKKRSVKKKSLIRKVTQLFRKKVIRKPKSTKVNFKISFSRKAQLQRASVLENDQLPLPYSYQKTMIVALVRDPLWLYAYWDFTKETWMWITQLFHENPNSKAAIRLHNLTQKSNRDFEISLDARQWYMEPGCPGDEIELELGIVDPNGNFYSIATSNRIRIPLNGPSSVIDPLWAPTHFDEFYRLAGGSSSNGSAAGSSFISASALLKPTKVSS